MKTYDIIIIGGGPAGIAAAIYATRKHLKTLLLSKDVGGQAAISFTVKNYIGYQFITAQHLIDELEEHQKNFNLELQTGNQVDSVQKTEQEFTVNTPNQHYQSRSVIIATGQEPKKLNVPGEKEFLGIGVSYCVTCDAAFFKNKIVAIIGGGSAATYSAIQLLSIAKRIYLINQKSMLQGNPALLNRITSTKSITIYNNTTIKEIVGDIIVKSIGIKHKNSQEEMLLVDGIFIEIGSEPTFPKIIANNQELKITSHHEIIINERCETNIPGLFAAGDVTTIPEKQVIVATGQGAVAGLSAVRFIHNSSK